jgi:thiamine biosynthesis lipoprotein
VAQGEKSLKYAVPLLLSVLLTCAGDVERRRLFFRMGTVTEITLSVPRSLDAGPIWRSVDSLLSTSEKRFSATGELSEIRAVNERADAADGRERLPPHGADSPSTEKIERVSPELGEMLRTGLAYGDTLDGSFDITVLPLKELWGFCEQCAGDEPLPDSTQVSAAVRKVDYRQVRVSDTGDGVIFGSPDTRIDVGGIAKGYVLRRIALLLGDRGVNNYLIAAGGDILISGRKPGNIPWRVGVRHPRDQAGLITAVSLESGALVTSGDYERFRIVDGQRYHHIFDPAAGYPCNENQSLTIRAGDPVRADILSTGLFCRPAAQILEFVRMRDDLECLIVDSSGKIHTSDDTFWF